MTSTKSYEDYVLGLYAAILKDVAVSYPGLRAEFDRDYKRLCSGVEHHGIAFLCDTLVAFAKHFDRCLDEQRLSPSGLIHMRPFKKGSTVPRLFRGLLLRVFHASGDLLPAPDVQAIQHLRLLFQLSKNAKLPCPTQRTYESVQEFISTDAEVRLPDLDWDSPDLGSYSVGSLQFRDTRLFDLSSLPNLWDSPDSGEERLSSCSGADLFAVQCTADVVSSALGRFEAADWKCRHGPGAVADLRGAVLDKYSFPTWPARMEKVFPCADFAFANQLLWADTLHHEEHLMPSEAESASRLLAVPKTYRAPRLIAAEPVAHQWGQQCLRDFLMSRVRHTPITDSIRFSDQMYNGNLALSSSRSGSHATIDLSQASDRISCFVIERLFRTNPTLLSGLHATRTLWITQELDKKLPRQIKLRKFSTMGSAVTFPVQTILFSVIAIAAVLQCEGRPVTIKGIRDAARRVRVFGDDIIVPIHAWRKTMGILATLGLKVNVSKTFGTGKFRESCGIDAYDGHIVNKINVNHAPSRAKPETVLSTLDCHNHLFLQGLWNAAQFVRKTVARLGGYSFPETAPSTGVIGWFTFDVPDNDHLKSRWNDRLCRREYLVSSPCGKSERAQLYGNRTLLQYFTDCVAKYPFIQGDRLGPPKRERAFSLRRTWVPLHGV